MTKSTKKVLIGLAVLLIAVAIVFGIGSQGFTNWNYKSYFNYWGKGAPTETKPIDPDIHVPSVFAYYDNGEAVCDGDELPEHMTFHYSTQALAEISKSATASISLVATIEPKEAGVKNVMWTARFTAGTRNVSEYVTVTQSATSPYQATVECLKSFSNEIEIECAVTDVYEECHTAICKLDYLSVPEKVTGISMAQTNKNVQPAYTEYNSVPTQGGVGGLYLLNIYYSGSNMYYNFVDKIDFSWSTGTVREEVSTDIEDITITMIYKSSTLQGAQPYTRSASLYWDFNGYVYGASNKGSAILTDSNNKPVITVTITLENGRAFDVYFECNFVKGVSSVNINTPSHVFGE